MWNYKYKCAYAVGWVIGFNFGWVALVTSWFTKEEPEVIFASLFEKALPTLYAIDRFFGVNQ